MNRQSSASTSHDRLAGMLTGQLPGGRRARETSTRILHRQCGSIGNRRAGTGRRHQKGSLVLTLLTLTILPAVLEAQSARPRAQTERYAPNAADVAAVERAGYGYIDAIYKADPSLVERYVHSLLVKIGYYTNQSGAWNEAPMTYAQLLDVARTWNRDGTTLRADAPREVVIYEVLDRTASAKVIAQWGIDYMQLVKYDDGWRIRHIVWQQHPGRAGARGGAS